MIYILDIDFLRRSIIATDEYEKYKDKFSPNTMGVVFEDKGDVFFCINRKFKKNSAVAH